MSDSIGSVSLSVKLTPDQKNIEVLAKSVSQAAKKAWAQQQIQKKKEAQAQERQRQAEQKKAQAQRLKDEQKFLKQRQKYELQYARQTKNKKKAIEMADARMAVRMQDAAKADALDHQDRMEQALKKKMGIGMKMFLSNTAANWVTGANRVASFAGQQTQILEDRESQKMLRQQYGEGAHKQAISMMIQTGVSVNDLAHAIKGLDDVIGAKGALSLANKISHLSDPLYNFNQQLGDMQNILRGGDTDTAGAFAKRYGQGNARMLNATMERQRMLVEAGVYQDINDSVLVREREARLNGVLSKAQANYTPNEALRMSRAIGSARMLADEEVAEQTTMLGVKSAQGLFGGVANAETMAQSKVLGKSVNTSQAAAEGNLVSVAANAVSLFRDIIESFAGILKQDKEEEKQRREMERLGGGYANNVAR
ncbi:MAG: hypothetical protein NC548_32290 [Lachnospiraceae bacterium]|nr:hypothetical protein [Lachnospiraceae bacterium]